MCIKKSLIISVFFVMVSCAGVVDNTKTQEAENNKKTVEIVVDEILDKKNTDNINVYFSSVYQEHGQENDFGISQLVKYLNSTKDVVVEREIYHLISDGDLVGMHSSVKFGNSSYIVVDIFRLQNLTIVERWHFTQDNTISLSTKDNWATQQRNPPFLVSEDLTNEYKSKTSLLYDEIFLKTDIDALTELLADDFVQHDSDIPQGKQGFIDMLAIGPIRQTAVMVISEGDIVFAYTKDDQNKIGLINIIRFTQESRIAEYWTIRGETN